MFNNKFLFVVVVVLTTVFSRIEMIFNYRMSRNDFGMSFTYEAYSLIYPTSWKLNVRRMKT